MSDKKYQDVLSEQGVKLGPGDKNPFGRPTFGSSDQAFGSDGAPISLAKDDEGKDRYSEEVCVVCQVASGGTKMGILREDAVMVALICPNCGETKNMARGAMKRPRIPQGPRT